MSRAQERFIALVIGIAGVLAIDDPRTMAGVVFLIASHEIFVRGLS